MTQSVPAGRGAVAGRRAHAAMPGRRPGGTTCRPCSGLTTVVVIGLIFAVAVGLFQGSFTETMPVTVISQRAGLVMNPDAKVKMRGVQVGKVASIESLPNGQAAIHLAMDPSQLRLIPGNVLVDIASSTVFGAKSVQLVEPARTLGAAATRRPDAAGPARHGRNQHGVPATGVGAGGTSTRRSSTSHWVRSHKRSVGGAHSSASR